VLLSIIVVVKENPEIVQQFIKGNYELLRKHLLITIDSGGGEDLHPLSAYYEKNHYDLSLARHRGIGIVKTKYVLNLDVDTILPPTYVTEAIAILEADDKVACVAIDYEKLQGHYAFGTSVWRSGVLKQLYDWKCGMGTCECIYMWSKVIKAGYRLETLPYRARHLKP